MQVCNADDIPPFRPSTRAVINNIAPVDRGNVLPRVPRESIEAILAAYCDSIAQVSGEPFQHLSDLVPDLDFQLFQQASNAFPGMSWETWADQVHAAAGDTMLRHELARGIVMSMVGQGVRRALNFDE